MNSLDWMRVLAHTCQGRAVRMLLLAAMQLWRFTT
jgi:hypothetical protein